MSSSGQTKPSLNIPSSRAVPKPVEATSPSAFKDRILNHHPSYYIPSGDVVIMVEKTLYRVHGCFLTPHSKMFAEILNSEESAPLSREAYVQLNSTISTAQFEAFLSLIYPAQLGVLVSRDETGWRNLLAFAAACDFTSLVTTALSGLNQYLKPIEKMLLGDKLAVPQLTAQGLREVCARAAPLSTKEGRELGIDNVMCVTNLREKTQCYMSGKADVLTDPLLKETLSQRDAEAAAAASSGNNEGPNGATAPADKMASTAGKTTRFGGGQTPAADSKKSFDANKSQSDTNGAGAGANGNSGNIKGNGSSGSRQRG